jgi:hypothetical protein
VNLNNLKGLVTVGKTFVAANRPEILFGMSIGSTLASVGLAAKGGYEAGRRVMTAEHPSYDLTKPEAGSELNLKDKAQLTWDCYVPAALGTVGAVASTTGLHVVHIKDKRALATAALGVIEETKDVARKFEEERDGALSANAKKDGTVKIENTDGEIEELYLVRDPITGRDIWSNKNRIEYAMLEVSNNVNGGGQASLNEFYTNGGWGEVPLGEELGWCGVFPEIRWYDEHTGVEISHVRDDGRPVKGFRFHPMPSKGYDGP